MKAIVQDRYGSPDHLRLCDVAEPEVGDREVRVRVRAASLHPDVWHMVTGRPWILRLGAGLRRPRNPIPGTDVAGEVEAVGRQVARFRVGDAVFGETLAASWWANGGAFAERVSAPESCLAAMPGNVTFPQAAAVPTAGYIALSNLPRSSDLREEGEALVNGAGGGVGCLALQILVARGMRVTAVDGPAKLELMRSLGADRVIDYSRRDFTEDWGRYDLVFDVPGNRPYSACRRALKPGGRYVLIGHEAYGKTGRRVFGLVPLFLWLMFRARFDRQLGSGRGSLPGKGEVMEELRTLLAAGDVTPVIDSVFPFGAIREAFRHLVEDQLRGRVILEPG